MFVRLARPTDSCPTGAGLARCADRARPSRRTERKVLVLGNRGERPPHPPLTHKASSRRAQREPGLLQDATKKSGGFGMTLGERVPKRPAALARGLRRAYPLRYVSGAAGDVARLGADALGARHALVSRTPDARHEKAYVHWIKRISSSRQTIRLVGARRLQRSSRALAVRDRVAASSRTRRSTRCSFSIARCSRSSFRGSRPVRAKRGHLPVVLTREDRGTGR